MSEYKFKGHDWTELAECWGITIKDQPINVIGLENEDDEEIREMFMTPESIEVRYSINGTSMVFTTEDGEEVLAEKTKKYIQEELIHKDNQSVRDDINNFLEELIKQSELTDDDYPVYRGILAIESNHTFAQWVARSLEHFWT